MFSGCCTTVQIFFLLTDGFSTGPSWLKFLVFFIWFVGFGFGFGFFWSLGFVWFFACVFFFFLIIVPSSASIQLERNGVLYNIKWLSLSEYGVMRVNVSWNAAPACGRREKGNLWGRRVPGGGLGRGCPCEPKESLPGSTEL